uniref:Major facilitator superfamily (MFS) profile domain-containing protein n=1 Tax=Knipowitschia caucasica TaxID=637954 RepID=A0AAV2JDV4_KNICA
MTTFDLGAFVAEPTSDVLDSCRKVDLLEIARHYEIPVSVTLRVGELREAVLAGLVASEVLVLPKSSNLEQGVTAGGAVASPVRLGESADSPQPPVGSPEVLFGEAEEKSFILSGVLPLGPQTDCHLSTVVKGIGLSYVPAPLHNVYIESNLVSGVFPVAVRDQVPIDGVEFIMGKDIAGGEVYPSPEVVSRPILSTGKDEVAEEHPEMSSGCVLTRAQSNKLAEERGDVDLCDSVLAPVFSGVRAPPCGRPDDHARTMASRGKSTTAMSPPLTSDALIGAQKFGRRSMLLVSLVLSTVMSAASAFSTSYVMFAVTRALSGAALSGLSIIGVVLGIEWTDVKHKTFTGTVRSLSWSAGSMVLALMAFLVRDWRHLTIAVTAPCVLGLLCCWWLPESARWLLANGRTEDARRFLVRCLVRPQSRD